MSQESPIPTNISAVLTELKIDNPKLLGKGGEGYIFELDPKRVLKIYPEAEMDYLQKLADFQKLIQGYNLPYATPTILELGQVNGISYTTERKLSGQPLDKLFPQLDETQQSQLLKNYYEAMKAFNSVELSQYPFGQILQIGEAITASSWQDFLRRKFEQRAKKSEPWLQKDVPDYESKVRKFRELIDTQLGSDEKHLVHCDYYFNNVLVEENLDISAVLDFSVHAVAGDPKLDAASIGFLTLDKNVRPDHLDHIKGLAKADFGEGIQKYIDLYGIYYAFYYADTYLFDRNSYEWSLRLLNDKKVWSKYT